MILDSSAIVAVLCRENGYASLLRKIQQADVIGVGAPTAFEAAMVLTLKLKRDGMAVLHDFLVESGTIVIPFVQEHSSCAFGAYIRYGKGRHPAALNFGDCLSYAASKVAEQPLLFVGEDFARTDVLAA